MLAGNLHGFDKSYKTGHMVVAFSQKNIIYVNKVHESQQNEIEINGHRFPSFRKYKKCVFSVFGAGFTFLAC